VVGNSKDGCKNDREKKNSKRNSHNDDNHE
jgi:hypothetical protein